MYRQIFTDGRKHAETTIPSWLGYPVGHWEHTHSDAPRIVERFHRKDLGHMDVTVTIDDPKTFARAVTFTSRTQRISARRTRLPV